MALGDVPVATHSRTILVTSSYSSVSDCTAITCVRRPASRRAVARSCLGLIPEIRVLLTSEHS